MVVCVKRERARLAAVVAVVVAFILAGCKVNGRVDLRADGGTKIDFTFEDSRDSMVKIHQTCKNAQFLFDKVAAFVNENKVEDIIPVGGHITCKLTSNKPLKGKEMGLYKKSNKYYYTYLGAHDGDYTSFKGFKTRIVVNVPARVVKSSFGSVEGRQVLLRILIS